MQKNLNPIMDFERVNQLLEDFNKSTGLVTAILDLEGNVLSQSGWRDICTLYHRKHPETAHNCLISDTELANKMAEGEKYHFYKCLNGLVDVATPIIINGEHVANLFTGQFFFEKPNIEFFRNQAKKYGFNEEKYLSALEKVPVISQEKAEANLNFLSSMAHLIGELSSQKSRLKESEALFKNIFEKSNVGKSITSPTGEIKVNQAFADMLGYTVDELQNIKWQDITPTEEIERIQKLIEPLVAGSKNNVRFEKRYIRKDGSLVWADLNTTIQRNESGEPDYFITTVVDISKQKQHEAKILRYSRIFEQSLNEIYTFEAGTFRFIELNKAALENLGYSLEEMKNKTPLDIKPLLDVHSFKNLVKPLLKGEKQIVVFETLHQRKDKSRYPVEVHLQLIKTEQQSYFNAIIIDITERKKAEEQLRLSEEKFRLAFKSSPDSVNINTLDGVYVDINEGFTKLTGFSHEDVVGKSSAEINIWDIPADREKLIAGLKERGYVSNLESKFRCKDGSIRTALMSAAIININGAPHILSITRDITAIKQAEQELKRSEAVLRMSQKIAKVGGWEYDVKSGETYFTDEIFEIYGLPKDKMFKAEDGAKFYHPDDRQKVMDAFGKAISEGKPYDLEARFINANGENLWVQTAGEPIYDNGEIVKVICTLMDITERKNTEIALRLSEEKFQSAFQISPVGVTINRISDGKFIEVNDAFLEMFEFNRDEVIGHTSLELNMMSSDERERLIKKQIETGGLRNYELKFQTKSGEPIYALFSSSPIEIEGEKCHLTIIIDISEKHYANIQLAESEKRYRSLFENMNAGFVLFEVVQDENGKTIDLIIVAANKGFEKTTGLDLRSAQGQRLTKVLPGIEKDEADWIGNYSEIARTGISKQFENYSKLLDTYYSVSAFKAGPNLCAVTFTDVTAAKKAELKLKESEAGSAKFMSSRRLPFSITTPKAI